MTQMNKQVTRPMSKAKVAIIGSGNIGTDLMIKVMRTAQHLEMAALVGVDSTSEGLARARRLGVCATDQGLEGLRRQPAYRDIELVFDATSAKAHASHAAILESDGKRVIDLTPAAVGPYVVPSVNLDANLQATNVNMVTCGGQATIPIVAAVRKVAAVPYGEIVASIASKSAGPGTRANIDEFTVTTARAIESVGGAGLGKAIIVLNPAEPPLIMRDTVYCLALTQDDRAVATAVAEMVAAVNEYVPGYRLKQAVQFEQLKETDGVRLRKGDAPLTGLKVAVYLEVEGAAHYLPAYAGNLDIMTSAALTTADRIVETQLRRAA